MPTTINNFDPISTELHKAINLIEASAGTGKTYAIAMLVLRFVVENNMDIKKILVVTFTKAATEELKDRIRLRLSQTRLIITENTLDTDPSINHWLNTLEIETEIILQRLNNALLDIDQAGIFTIHGFCQRILAEHALESGQLFDSELTGDISTIKQACSDDFWRKQIYQRSDWEASLLTAQYKTPDQLLSSIDYISADLAIYPEYQNLDEKLQDLKQLIENSKQTISFALSLIEEQLAEGKYKKTFSLAFSNESENLLQWINHNSTLIPDFSILTEQGLVNALNGVKFKTSKANPLSSEEQKINYISQLKLNTPLFEKINTSINEITLVLRRTLLETLRIDITKRLQQLNVLSFDDLITRFSDALKDNNSHILRQEIQLRFQATLIDEFQDTDQSQWFIFSTLFNSPNHYLYLIGDPKQAIYKFRGADINSYFAAKEQAQYHFTLGNNWRSHPQLVQGVNKIFNREQPFLTENLAYNEVHAALNSGDGAITHKDQAIAPVVLWQLQNKENDSFWASTKASNEIVIATVNEVLALLSPSYAIETTSQQKSIIPKDIAILVRTNPQAKTFQRALNEAGITSVINSKESVFSSEEAINLSILLQAIIQPSNPQRLKQALTLDWFNLNGQQLFQALNNEQIMDGWLSRFLEYQQTWQKKGLMGMMKQCLKNENIQVNLSEKSLAERRITNLQHCIELVQQAAIEEHLGVNKTLDFLLQNIHQSLNNPTSSDEQQLRLESDQDAIKIITMHSSKGLEFPIVFCPFLWQRGEQLKKERHVIKCFEKGEMIADLGSSLFEQHREIALKEELAEDLRVFYVAITRAKYRCYLNWADVRTKAKANASAMAYLFNFTADDFLQQQNKLKSFQSLNPTIFEYQLLETEQTIHSIYSPSTNKTSYSFKERQRALYTQWQMSSYTALSSLSQTETPEIPDDKAREEIVSHWVASDYAELPRGVQTGNVIHDLLENIPFHMLADKESDISEQRDKSCQRYGVKTKKPEQLNLLLKHTVSTPLSENDDIFCLKNLSNKQCLTEMPFYLSIKTLNVSHINTILRDDPSFKPLTNKTLQGYLTGFIDLICKFKNQYYVIDYKSNSLESYDTDHLTQSMREHNYGLQYWIYTLVLHLYLKNRLPNYHYKTHIGGIKYLFVRGMNEKQNNSGVYQIKPEFNKIEQLENLLIAH